MSLKLLHKKLIKKRMTISVVESCTGGLLAHNLTKLSNSSNYFRIGLVAYSNDSKLRILKVNKKTIIKHGTVSYECCKEMVEKLSKLSKSIINVSVTGIAGPNGGSKEKPVGLVYVGIRIKNKLIILKNNFKTKKRFDIQNLTVKKIIKTILRLIE